MGTALGGGPLTQLSSLVGRTYELVELARLLHDVRLLTLTGPAGVGKSRLALELAGQELRSQRHDISVVRLGPRSEPDEIRRQVLTALGETPTAASAAASDGPDSTGRDHLLLLDDCEHVLDICGRPLTELLPGRPRLRVLATSREPLQLPGETIFSVAGLTLPEAGSDTVLNACLRSDAVTLFVDRARAVVPGFRLTHDNATHLGEICARLDGLPLPIEMAARLIRIFPPAEIVTRLEDRLTLLTNGWRLADDRHQSLRASLEWGYDLLRPEEQALLRRLSVLSGDFGPDAATAVASDLPIPPAVIPQLLIDLVTKSLITPLADTSGPTRFRLLESIRCFGHDRLIAESEETGTYERLVSWLTAMCLPLHGEAAVPPAALEQLAKEHANLTHVLHRLRTGTDERQLLLASALAAVDTVDGRVTGTAALTAEARETAFRALPTARAKESLEAGGAMRRSQALALALGHGTTDAPREERSGHPLSKREWEVTALVVEGLTNRQIAALVHVSVRTVETHIRQIRTTLGLRSRAHIAAWAAQQHNDARPRTGGAHRPR